MRQSADRGGAAFALRDHVVQLARDGTMRPQAKTAALLWGDDPGLADGPLLTLHHVSGPLDVHYPAWEMHPEGDELLILLSGALAVELRLGGEVRTVALVPQLALFVPAGIWHRLVVDEPSVLIAITPRHGTAHEGGQP